MPALTPAEISAIDAAHIWHPYSAIGAEAAPPVVAVGASGASLTVIVDGTQVEVLDAMSSWWTAIHGHGHPALDYAIASQLARMNHVMFGGLTHEPAARLAQLLVDITPDGLDTVFFSDSGSVSVEVAVKMALQYWRSQDRKNKHRLMTWRGGYHGDTFTPMSVCDPDGGMHSLWTDVLAHQVFAPQVPGEYDPAYSAAFEAQLAEHADELAAVIVEPVVQGAGGMRFHDPRYLTDLRDFCDRNEVLLIFDEIATGFGRTGALFAAEHAGVSPDIMCVGKALTGGYITLAATLCTTHIARTISDNEPGALMHGPTFMASALACAVAVASVELLLGQDWRARVAEIHAGLRDGLEPARSAAWRDGRAGARRHRRHRNGGTGRHAGCDGGGARARHLAAAVSQPRLCDAAVHLHPRRDRADHLRDGRRRSCINLNTVQLSAQPTMVNCRTEGAL